MLWMRKIFRFWNRRKYQEEHVAAMCTVALFEGEEAGDAGPFDRRHFWLATVPQRKRQILCDRSFVLVENQIELASHWLLACHHMNCIGTVAGRLRSARQHARLARLHWNSSA